MKNEKKIRKKKFFFTISEMLSATQHGKQTVNTDLPDSHGTQGTTADSVQTSFTDTVICSRTSTLTKLINATPP
jgi:hypothetical protein